MCLRWFFILLSLSVVLLLIQEEKKDLETKQKDYEGLASFLKKTLGEKVRESCRWHDEMLHKDILIVLTPPSLLQFSTCCFLPRKAAA